MKKLLLLAALLVGTVAFAKPGRVRSFSCENAEVSPVNIRLILVSDNETNKNSIIFSSSQHTTGKVEGTWKLTTKAGSLLEGFTVSLSGINTGQTLVINQLQGNEYTLDLVMDTRTLSYKCDQTLSRR